MIDPVAAVTTVAEHAITESAQESGKGFLRRVLQAPGDAIGEWLADPIRERRHANLIKIALRAKKRLEDVGVSPKAVPLSIIHPALDAASLEEQPDMQEIWANLLANAADPRDGKSVRLSFPGILKELSPREVKFLDALFQMALDQTVGPKRRYAWVSAVNFEHGDIYDVFRQAGLARFVPTEGTDEAAWEASRTVIDADHREADMCMDTLRRQELVIESVEMDKHDRVIEGSYQGISWRLPRDEFYLSYRYSFSRLGVAFVNACRPPQSEDVDRAT